MSDITLNTNIKEIHFNSSSDNVKGVILKDSDGTSHKVWGHPYTFKWGWDSNLNTTSSSLTIPSKYFIHSPDNLLTFQKVSSSSNTNAYMPNQDGYTLSRETDNTVYYGDKVTCSKSSWDTSKLDPCVKDIQFSITPTSSSLSSITVTANTSVKVLPTVNNYVSFIKCEIPSTMTNYFSAVNISYYNYSSSSSSTKLTPTSSTNYIAGKISSSDTYRNVTAFWLCNSNYSIGYDNSTSPFPLWDRYYTTSTFPTSQYNSVSLTTPSMDGLKFYDMNDSFKLPFYFSSASLKSHSWYGEVTCKLTFTATLDWAKYSKSSPYSYYKVAIIGTQLQGTSDVYKYDPTTTNASYGFRIDSSNYFDSSILSSAGTFTATFPETGIFTQYQSKNIYILWRAVVLGSTKSSPTSSDWEFVSIYSSPTYNNYKYGG